MNTNCDKDVYILGLAEMAKEDTTKKRAREKETKEKDKKARDMMLLSMKETENSKARLIIKPRGKAKKESPWRDIFTFDECDGY